MQKPEYFTKFPNDYIQGDIRSKYGVSRKFYITYILIDRYRSYEDYSWITIRKVMEFYGYKTTKHKPKVFHEILDVLEYMINNRMIEIKQNLDSIGYDTGIEIKVIPENFDVADKFSKITSSQLDFIMMAESSINKENLLMAFLYINSYIYIRPRNNRNQEIMKNPSSKPEAFWKNVDSMSKELSMSKDTINQRDWLPFVAVLDNSLFRTSSVNQKQINKIYSILKKYINERKCIYISDSDSKEEKTEKVKKLKADLVSDIDSETIGFSTIYRLLSSLEDKENSQIKNLLLEILYLCGNESFNKAIIQSKKEIKQLTENGNDINIFGIGFDIIEKRLSNGK